MGKFRIVVDAACRAAVRHAIFLGSVVHGVGERVRVAALRIALFIPLFVSLCRPFGFWVELSAFRPHSFRHPLSLPFFRLTQGIKLSKYDHY